MVGTASLTTKDIHSSSFAFMSAGVSIHRESKLHLDTLYGICTLRLGLAAILLGQYECEVLGVPEPEEKRFISMYRLI